MRAMEVPAAGAQSAFASRHRGSYTEVQEHHPPLRFQAARPGSIPRRVDMTQVAQILNSKPAQQVFTIAESASVYDAIKLMAEKGIGALVVMRHDEIAGIVTERDYARKVVLKDRSSKNTHVSEIMSSGVRYVHREQTSQDCMALMTEHRLRHLPVIEKGRLIGMISIGDLVKDIISEQEFTIQQLEHYITGGTI
jgi:CBS domain-containing protein